jgi:hypothetical protein
MMASSGNANDRYFSAPPDETEDIEGGQSVVSALFHDTASASAAIRELREIGVLADDISVISRDRSASDETGALGAPGIAGVDQEVAPEDGTTFRASSELPNDEDLTTNGAAVTGSDMPPAPTPAESESFGGLSRDSVIVRRSEAGTNADEDIYSDFPGEPGGVNPDSPVAQNAGSDVQAAADGRTSVAGNAAVGASIGGVVGLLAGLVGLAIPGVGPFLAAGPLAGVLSGIVTGATAGGLIGALSGIGVPEEYAREYASAIEQGQTLISVRTDSLNHDSVERVLIANRGDALH